MDALDRVLRAVPADGSASLRTGDVFNCRVWVKDALVALQNHRIIDLASSIGMFQREITLLFCRLPR
jgi:hypothetical protein